MHEGGGSGGHLQRFSERRALGVLSQELTASRVLEGAYLLVERDRLEADSELHSSRRAQRIEGTAIDAAIRLAEEHFLLGKSSRRCADGRKARDVRNLAGADTPVPAIRLVGIGDDAAGVAMNVAEIAIRVRVDRGVEVVIAKHVAERHRNPAPEHPAKRSVPR